MRNLRLLGVLAGGVVALLGAVLLGVWLFVNPNAYKGKIAAAVKESTGRELKLPGDIKLSVIPWVALELGPASLGNPPGFSDEPFLSFRHASVRVRLLPLLRQRLEVARVQVEGLDLRLRKNAAGRGNWQGVEPEQPEAKSDLDHTDAVHALESLANIRIDNGRVTYAGLTVEKFNMETGSLADDRHIPINLTLDASRAPSGEQLSLTAKFDLSQDAAQKALRFGAVNLSGTLARPGDGRPAHWDLSAPAIDVNVTQQSLAAPAFTLSYSGAHFTGSAQATKIIDDLSVNGSVTLAPLVLREMEPRLGFSLPKTRDPKVLSQLSATTDFAFDPQGLALTHLQLRLDDTQIQGSLKLLAGDTTALQFDLTADQIDLDRYRAPPGGPVAEESAPAASASPEKAWDANGTLAIQSAKVARLDLSNLRVTVAAKDKVMHLSPVEAQLDGGRSSGDITWDSRGAMPTLSVDEQLTGIDMARLLANTAGKGRLSGRATLNLKATGRGAGVEALLKTLTGHLDANLADGALEGIDVGHAISVAQALIDKSPAPAQGSTGHTPFQAFKLSSQITNGVAETHDLTIASQALTVTGQGSANLATKGIDFKLLASIVTAPARNTDIPLKVSGTYANPTVRPDIEGLAKDQLKQKLQDILKKNGLQGLFTK
jgi:AsmA protein